MNSTGLPNVMQIFFLFLSCYLFRALVLPNLSRALTMDEFFEIVTFYFLLFIPVKLPFLKQEIQAMHNKMCFQDFHA